MRPETRHYYSRGKLLLTGEYMVLHGALSLALPLRLGQHMHVRLQKGRSRIHWNANNLGSHWFNAVIDPVEWEIEDASDNATGNWLVNLLKAASEINPVLSGRKMSWHVDTELEFDLEWGLGSSSSLISNVAYWFGIDPYALFRRVAGGSGYDIFASRADSPLWYCLKDQRPVVQDVSFNPPFRDNIYFIFLGKKKKSEESISGFLKNVTPGKEDTNEITWLTEKITRSDDLHEFEELIEIHEDRLSRLLGMKTVKEERFADFQGSVKSLGAWGGDFAMMTWRNTPEELMEYLHTKGIDVVFPYNEIIL